MAWAFGPAACNATTLAAQRVTMTAAVSNLWFQMATLLEIDSILEEYDAVRAVVRMAFSNSVAERCSHRASMPPNSKQAMKWITGFCGMNDG